MPRVRVVMDGADAPVAQSDSWMTLYRRTPVVSQRSERNYRKVRRQEEAEEEEKEEEGSEEEEEDEEEDEADEDEEETDSSEDTDGSDSSGEDGESSSSSDSDSDAEEEELTPAQQRLQQASPFSDFELPSVPNLGALPVPPLNTRRSMRIDKIKRRPRGTPSRRQLPGPPPDEFSSESSELDGISSESEDEGLASSGNAPPFSPPPSLPLPPPEELDVPTPLPPPAVVSEQPPRSTSRSSSSDGSSPSQLDTRTSRQLVPPATRTPTDNASSATITASPSSSPTSIDLGQSTFIAAADATGTSSSALPAGPGATSASQQAAGPAPESQTAMIAGVTVLGVAVVATVIFLLFRFCIPLRTWYTSRRQKHRDDKAERLGTAPSAWKWPLQFIFGSDRPAPPRRQQHLSEFYHHEKVGSYASNRDLENQTSPGLVADGFRPPQGTSNSPPQYKSFTTASNANSYVANGWRAPLSHISQRLSNWPRRSGTARWFFGGGASRWSDSEASEAAGARTTYSEGQLVDMYGAPTPRSVAPRRSSIAKSPLQVQVSQTELASPSPPLPVYRNATKATSPATPIALSPKIVTTTIIKPPSASKKGLGLTQTPVRPRASPRATPRNSYLRSSVATTATSGTGALTMEPPPLPFAGFGFKGQQVSHFSASTVDPATPRRFVGEGLPKGPRVGSGSAGRFPVRAGSVSSLGSQEGLGGEEKPLPVLKG